jgi:hypothetical protein
MGSKPGLAPRAMRESAWKEYVGRAASGDQSGLAALYDESSSLVYSVVTMSQSLISVGRACFSLPSPLCGEAACSELRSTRRAS